VADGAGLRPFRVAGARRPALPGGVAALPGSASASASAGVAAAHEHFPAGGLGASLGQAMRAAAEGAGLASAQRARTPGSDAVRAFVGGPFPNVARAPQSTDPPDPAPDSAPAGGPGVAAGEGEAVEGDAGGEGPAGAGERFESGDGPS
jgi:hypothetical protein